MAKCRVTIGYTTLVNKGNGVWSDEITEISYTGDILEDNRRWLSNPEKLNEDLVLENKVSIIANPYILDNHQYIRYITIYGAKWKVSRIEIVRPRIILHTGGVYV